MQNISRLGLDVNIALNRGLDAAIEQHDSLATIPYQTKQKFLWEKREEKDNILELMTEAKEASKDSMVDSAKWTLRGVPDSRVNILKANKEMKNKVNKLVDTNKEAVINTAYLALGKLVIDDATSKLPKEVGLLGPLAVAELLQVLPLEGEKLEKAKTAALTYAMYQTYYKTDVSKFVEELSGMAEEI